MSLCSAEGERTGLSESWVVCLWGGEVIIRLQGGRLEDEHEGRGQGGWLTMVDVGVRPMCSSISLVVSINGGQADLRAPCCCCGWCCDCCC